MSSNPQPGSALVELIAPQRRGDRQPVEDQQYALMLLRMIRALEARVIERPENLPLVLGLQERLAEVANVAIAVNAERFALDPTLGASMAECGRAIGVSKQAASQRRERGERAIAIRLEEAGVTRFAEAKRERELVETTTQQGVISLADYRARHAAA